VLEQGSKRIFAESMLPDIDSTFRVFAAHWRTVGQEWSYPLHRHPLFEVNLVLSGQQQMTVNGKVYVQKPGDLLLLRPGDKHESRAVGEEEMTYYCLHFDVDERSFRELLNRNPDCFYPASSKLTCTIRPALDKLISLTSQEAVVQVETRMSILSALFELFAGLSGSLPRINKGKSSASISSAAAQIASMLEQAVEQGVGEGGEEDSKETIESIAAEIGYSPSSINRMFTKSYGMSPRQYMSSLMLKKAKLLLLDPELTIEEISLQLGYRNIAHFSRQFKRWTGESPSSFRGRV